MAERMPVTREGYQALTAELKRLKAVEKPKILKELATAREHGDLSENAEYDAAKERQEMLYKRIGELEEKLGRAEIIDTSRITGERVIFGAVVLVYNIDRDYEERFQVVGELETDATRGKISVHSPLGRVLIGKEIGDEVTVKAPAGDIHLEILEISAPSPAS